MRPVRTRQSDTNLIKMGVPRQFLNSTLEDYQDGLNIVKPFVSEYLSNLVNNIDSGVGLFFYGSNGVGKSMLSCIIMRQAYMHRYTCKRCTYMDYINEYTRMWGCKNEEDKTRLEEDFYYYYKGTEFLVLEEVGKEVDSKISVTILEDLLRYREEKRLTTIICTNLEPKDIKDIYGASIFSLVKGCFTPIKIVGQDLRQSVFKERSGNNEE